MIAQRYVVSNRIAYKGPFSRLFTKFLEHDYSFDSVLSRLEDYLAIEDTGEYQGLVDDLSLKVIPKNRISFEDRISKLK